MDLTHILQQVAAGRLDAAEAQRLIQSAGEGDLGFARIDLERADRCGLSEVVFGQGKTPDQIVRIVTALLDAGQNAFVTRAEPGACARVQQAFPEAVHHEAARIIAVRQDAPAPPQGQVAVVCAGTSDIPVAEEAAVTAEWMGAKVERVFDVGVAGLHRLMRRLDILRASRALVVAAGMEGALPSVVGGLVDRPLIAVPTSIGYGMNLNGISALLAMLNSCAAGITVVNVDNGFGAGVAAAKINRLADG